MILSAFWIKLKCRWLQSDLADLEKTSNTSIFAKGRFFTHFRNNFFLRFLKKNENHQKHMLKWLNAFLLSEHGSPNPIELDYSIL